MNEYLKQYIELQKQFRETKGNPDSVRALYTFKEKLELSEDKQAKEVLVDVYDLLDFKKDCAAWPEKGHIWRSRAFARMRSRRLP